MIFEQHKPTAHQRSAARKGSNTQHNNRTDTTCASRSPTKRHPHPHGTPTHRPRHAPTNQPTHHATAVQQQTDALFGTGTSPEQAGYTVERTKYFFKYCCCAEDSNSSISHIANMHESTHPRTKRPPPTHPTNRPPTDQSILLQNTPTNTCYGSTAVRTSWYVHQQMKALLVSNLFIVLKTHSWVRCTSSGVQARVKGNHPSSPIHRPTHNPPTNRYRYLLLHAEDTRTCDYSALDQNKAPSVRFYYDVVVRFS